MSPLRSLAFLCLLTTLLTRPSLAEDPLVYARESPGCQIHEFGANDLVPNGDGYVFIPEFNVTVYPGLYNMVGKSLKVCYNQSEDLQQEIMRKCDLLIYTSNEFTKLDNGSVLVEGEGLFIPGAFFLIDGELELCSFDELLFNETNGTYVQPSDTSKAFIALGKTGCSISIIALVANLVIFCMVSSLRNLPGWNLASMSVAFLFAYLFMLIGMIPEVLGASCVVSAILQQYFFLVAFFCMNTLAFDIWRTIRLATSTLTCTTEKHKRRQFVYYSLFAWGTPLLFSISAAVIQISDDIPEWIQPRIGDRNLCWFNNGKAHMLFFSGPIFVLIFINTIFFILTAVTIKTNSIQCSSEDHKQNSKVYFTLYVRLGAMMGFTWLLGVVGAASNDIVIWYIHDIFNSLQGLFLFLLSTCSRKVYSHVRQRLSLKKTPPAGQKPNSTSTTTKTESDPV